MRDRADTTEYWPVYKGSYRYGCMMCGHVARKDEIGDECDRCGRRITWVGGAKRAGKKGGASHENAQ